MNTGIPRNAYILVADGTRAIAFENIAEQRDLELRKLKILLPENLLDDGPAGKRPPEEDQRATDEATFAKQLAEHLNGITLNNDFRHLVLVADPQTLGQIRPSLHSATEMRIVRSVNKTLTNSTVGDIERALA